MVINEEMPAKKRILSKVAPKKVLISGGAQECPVISDYGRCFQEDCLIRFLERMDIGTGLINY